MITFFNQLLFDNYAYCPWNKQIPNWICRKFKLLKVGVWLINLNSNVVLYEEDRYWRLEFTNGTYGNFWLDKKLYTVSQRIKNER